jgi:hypothetical protein
MTPDRLRKVALVLGSLLLMALAYAAARYWQTETDDFARQTLSAACDLRAGPCRHALGEGVVTLAIAPRSIPLMQPLRLEVDAEGLDVVEALVEIRGLNMDMGLNRTRLTRRADGRWVGETILPICSQRRMEWEAAVRLIGRQRIEVPFPFYTVRR